MGSLTQCGVYLERLTVEFQRPHRSCGNQDSIVFELAANGSSVVGVSHSHKCSLCINLALASIGRMREAWRSRFDAINEVH